MKRGLNIALDKPVLPIYAATPEGACLLSEALPLYEHSLRIRQEIGDKAGEAVTSWNIGLTYKERGDLRKAEPYISRAVQLAEELGHPDLEQDRAALARLRAQLKAQSGRFANRPCAAAGWNAWPQQAGTIRCSKLGRSAAASWNVAPQQAGTKCCSLLEPSVAACWNRIRRSRLRRSHSALDKKSKAPYTAVCNNCIFVSRA